MHYSDVIDYNKAQVIQNSNKFNPLKSRQLESNLEGVSDMDILNFSESVNGFQEQDLQMMQRSKQSFKSSNKDPLHPAT